MLTILGESGFVVDATAVRTLAATFLSGAIAACVVVVFARFRSRNMEGAVMDVMEIVTIVAAFAILHPLFAMGLYLLTWHSWRHMLAVRPLLMRVDSDGNHPSWSKLFVRLHIASLPLLLPTLTIFLTLAWWRLDTTSVYGLAAVAIAIFAVVTYRITCSLNDLCTGLRFAADHFEASLA